MQIKEKLPFLSSTNGEKNLKGRVRLLAKFQKYDEFELEDFNELVRDAIDRMDKAEENRAVLLTEETADRITEEELLERHLSYKVDATTGDLTESDNKEEIVGESKSFKVILRAQPHRAIELNGPRDVTSSYRDAVKETFAEMTGNRISFNDILSS